MWSVQWRFALVLSLALGCGFTDKSKVPAPDGTTNPPPDAAQDVGSGDGEPSGWTCDPSKFGENDTTGLCDCGCGIPDPNCGGAGCVEENCCGLRDCPVGCVWCGQVPCD